MLYRSYRSSNSFVFFFFVNTLYQSILEGSRFLSTFSQLISHYKRIVKSAAYETIAQITANATPEQMQGIMNNSDLLCEIIENIPALDIKVNIQNIFCSS